MSETKDKPEDSGSDKKQRKPMTLKGSVSSGTVRQSFSHGRTKTVVVETKRKRAVAPGGASAEAPVHRPKPTVAKQKSKADAPADSSKDKPQRGQVLRELTEEERVARARALEDAKAHEEERLKREAIEAKRREEEEARRAQEREEQRKREEEEARKAAEAEAAAKEAEARANTDERAKSEAKAKAAEPEVVDPAAAPPPPEERKPGSKKREEDSAPRGKKATEAEEEAETKSRAKTKPGASAPKPAPSRRGEPKRRSGKLTITRALSDDDEDRGRSLASVRRARERERRAAQSRTEPQKIVRDVIIPESITVQELASRMAIRAADVIKSLMQQGMMMTINDFLDADTAQLVAEEYGHAVKRISEADVEEGLSTEEDSDENKQPRPPVVTVMGHVDHGKTSLLDALRKANVVQGEAGGITQHIGAYQVQAPSGDKITFIDTPGHAAFTAMRARGAKVTDIVVLVVASDDGVMPQTVEAISHAKAAEVPIIVAINKMDKPEANPDRVRQELLQHDMVVESLGGDILDVPVSAINGDGLDQLTESILLQAEILELKANPERPGEGVVVEAQLDRGRGSVATVLVERGTLRQGDIFVAGAEWGRVRALVDDHGNQIKEAGPAQPVEVLGLQGVPGAGDNFVVVESEARAREVSDYRQRKEKDARARVIGGRGSLEQMMTKLKEAEIQELPIVIKSDVQGSLEAIIGALENLSTEEVRVRVLHGGVGGITESDVILANASEAPIIGFNVRANKQARETAEQGGTEIRYYSVIYDLVDDIKAAMSGLLAPTLKETFLGNAEILEVFTVSKVSSVQSSLRTPDHFRVIQLKRR